MKALITGGTGFVGPYLAAHCREHGDDVVAVDRSGPDRLDITDRDAVHDSFARHAPEIVYHLAGLTHVGDSWSDPAAHPSGTRVHSLSRLTTCQLLPGMS